MTDKQRSDYRHRARTLATFEKAYTPEYVRGTSIGGAQSIACHPFSSKGSETFLKEPDMIKISPAASEVSLTSVPNK